MSNKSSLRIVMRASSCVVFALLLACSQPGSNPKSGADDDAEIPVPVEATAATHRAMVASFSGTAALEPENQAMVVAKTSGILLRLMVEEGDVVRAGDLLAQLDPEKPRLELARAEANLKRLENDFRRANDLYARKLVSAEAQEKARFDLETQKAAYDIAKLELDYTRIVAPISGVISQRLVKEGNLIQINQSLFRIDDFDPLLAVLNVPERELTTMRAGQQTTMRVDALAGMSFSGTVARVSPVVDAQTGTLRVTTEFRDAEQRLKSGMFGRVDVIYDQREQALVVPREALIEGDAVSAVFLLEPAPALAAKASKPESPGFLAKLFGKEEAKKAPNAAAKTEKTFVARRREVKLGYQSGTDAEVLEGVQAGDLVVTVGKAGLRDGGKVQIVAPEAP